MNFADNQGKPQDKSTMSKPSTNIAIALLLISALLVSPLIARGQTDAAEICDNGVDDNNDGLVDGEDTASCGSVSVAEICDNGVDDNNDGLVDGEDTASCGSVSVGNNITIATPPYQIALNYQSGELDAATNVIYRVHFDFGDIDASINATDSGTFDSVSLIDKNTVEYLANEIPRGDIKNAIVNLRFPAGLTDEDVKVNVQSQLTINGITQTQKQDPPGIGSLSVVSEILTLAERSFSFALKLNKEIPPCLHMTIDPISANNGSYVVHSTSCSQHAQILKLSSTSIPAGIQPAFNPSQTDIAAGQSATAKVQLCRPADAQIGAQYRFIVRGDIVMNVFGSASTVSSSFADDFHSVSGGEIVCSTPPPPPPQAGECHNLLIVCWDPLFGG